MAAWHEGIGGAVDGGQSRQLLLHRATAAAVLRPASRATGAAAGAAECGHGGDAAADGHADEQHAAAGKQQCEHDGGHARCAARDGLGAEAEFP